MLICFPTRISVSVESAHIYVIVWSISWCEHRAKKERKGHLLLKSRLIYCVWWWKRQQMSGFGAWILKCASVHPSSISVLRSLCSDNKHDCDASKSTTRTLLVRSYSLMSLISTSEDTREGDKKVGAQFKRPQPHCPQFQGRKINHNSCLKKHDEAIHRYSWLLDVPSCMEHQPSFYSSKIGLGL